MHPLRNQLLVDELQLVSQLNHCVHNSHKATFGLLLAMLSQDICDQPRFDDSISNQQTTDEALRQQLQLPPSYPMTQSVEAYSDQAVYLGKLLRLGLRSSIALQVTLRPEPLATRDDKLAVDELVRTNISMLGQAKLSPCTQVATPAGFTRMEEVETQIRYVEAAA